MTNEQQINIRRRFWRILPYGFFIHNDKKIYYNRDYSSLYSEAKNGKIIKLKDHIDYNGKGTWFYDDTNPPWKSTQTLCKMLLLWARLDSATYKDKFYNMENETQELRSVTR